mgnify:CR=1 FL=1
MDAWKPNKKVKFSKNGPRHGTPGDWQQVEAYKHASLLLEDGEQIVDPKDAEQQSIKYANGTF